MKNFKFTYLNRKLLVLVSRLINLTFHFFQLKIQLFDVLLEGLNLRLKRSLLVLGFLKTLFKTYDFFIQIIFFLIPFFFFFFCLFKGLFAPFLKLISERLKTELQSLSFLLKFVRLFGNLGNLFLIVFFSFLIFFGLVVHILYEICLLFI